MLRAVGAVLGCVPVAAAGRNGPGTGYLKAGTAGLQWRAPGSATYGPLVPVAADGTVLLEDGEDSDCWLRVQVYATWLPSDSREGPVELTDRYGGAFGDDFTASDTRDTWDSTITLTLANDGPLDVLNLRAWIDTTVAGGDLIEISDDGSTWVSPDSEAHADVLVWDRLAAGGTTSLYVRRYIASSVGTSPDLTTVVQLAWDGL